MANLEYMNFYIITPSGAINYVTNPTPYRATTGYTAYDAGGGTAIAASDTYTRRGPKCIQVTAVAAEAGGVYFGTVSITDTLKYTFSVDVKGIDGEAMRIKIEDAGGTYTATTTFTATGDWQRVQVTITAQETASDYRLYVIRDSQAGESIFYVDGFQFEQADEATTFFSGDTAGFADDDFYWNGTPHASTSTRSADTRAGGTLMDIRDHAEIAGAFGFGMGNYRQVYNELVSGGALYQKHIRKPRNISLILDYSGTWEQMHTARNTILEAVMPDDDTPMVIRYQGTDTSGNQATQPLDIVCIPQPSHQDTPDLPAYQRDILTFTVLDGYLKGAYKEGKELDPYDTLADADCFVMRDADGLWSVPNNGGTGIVPLVWALAEAPNGDIYIGGNFTNAGGDADADYLAKWDGTSITAVLAGFNSNVEDLCFDAAGNLYIGGSFTNVGDGDGDRIVKWDGSAVSSLGTGMNGTVNALAIDPITGYLYAGGAFTLAGGVANTTRIAYWNGTSWVAMATGLNSVVYTMAFAPDGNLYIGGAFTNADGVDGDYICYWNGTAFVRIGTTELSSDVRKLTFDSNGILYAGGLFVNAGGDTNADGIARFYGNSWHSLAGGGVPSGQRVNRVYIVNNDVYITGNFTSIGGLSSMDRIAIFRSGSWVSADIALPPLDVYTILNSRDGALYVGGDFTGTATANDQKTVTNSGNTNVYPTIEITGPGVLQGFSNFTTGASIQFDGLTLQDGEILTISLDPTDLKMTSNWRGNCLRYVNAGSDLGDFYLKPGDNSITFFMPSGTTAATKAYLYYTPTFWNIEGALL